ncbi:hypothetical protein BZA77DRAFT_362841 [Pyronema omphalodes]|nr:hypothetical protein BZA77DRAFT_362841 [Pyronema omphalodes]
MAITPPRFNPDISGFTDTPEIPSPRVPAVRPAADAPEEQQDDSLLNNEIGMPDGDASLHEFELRYLRSRKHERLLGEGNTTILAPRRSNRGTLRDSILGTPVAYTGERSHVQFQLSEASPDSTPAGYNSFLDHSHEDTLALIRPIETQFGPRPARIFDANRSAERLVPYRDPDAPPAAPVTAPAQTRAPISRLQILRDSEASAAGPSASTTPTRTLRPRSTDGRTFGTALTVPSATDTPEQPRSVSKWDQNKNQPLPRTGDAIWQEYPSPVNMTPDVMFKWHNWPPRKESDPALQNMNRFRLPFPKDAPQNAEPESELNRLQEAEKTLNPFRPWENLSEEELLAVPLPVVLLSPEVTDAILVAFQTHLVDEKIAEAGKTEKIPFAGPPPPKIYQTYPVPPLSQISGSLLQRMCQEFGFRSIFNTPLFPYVRGSSDDILTLNDEPHVPYISSGLSSSTDISEGAIASRRTIVHNPADIHSDPAMSVLDHEYDNLLKYHHEDTPNYWAEVLKENKPWVMDHTARILNSLPEQRLENDPKMAVVPSSAVLAFVQNYKDPGPQPKTAETETGTSSPSPSRPPAWHALTDQVDKTKPFVPRENRTDEEERALDEDIARNEQELEKNFRMQREMVAYGSDFRRQYDPAKSAAHRTEREKFNAAQQRWDDRFDPPLSKQTVVNTKTYAGASANRQRV